MTHSRDVDSTTSVEPNVGKISAGVCPISHLLHNLMMLDQFPTAADMLQGLSLIAS